MSSALSVQGRFPQQTRGMIRQRTVLQYSSHAEPYFLLHSLMSRESRCTSRMMKQIMQYHGRRWLKPAVTKHRFSLTVLQNIFFQVNIRNIRETLKTNGNIHRLTTTSREKLKNFWSRIESLNQITPWQCAVLCPCEDSNQYQTSHCVHLRANQHNERLNYLHGHINFNMRFSLCTHHKMNN